MTARISRDRYDRLRAHGYAPQAWACCISSIIGPACGHLTDSIDRHPAGRAISKEQQP